MAYAYSADPDQIAPEGAVWSGSTLFAIPMYFKNQLPEKQNLVKKSMKQSVWNFRIFTVCLWGEIRKKKSKKNLEL